MHTKLSLNGKSAKELRNEKTHRFKTIQPEEVGMDQKVLDQMVGEMASLEDKKSGHC